LCAWDGEVRAGGPDPGIRLDLPAVASFFVSRVDTAVDPQLEAIGTPEALALRGKAAVANARLAYQEFEETFSGPRWQRLADAGARVQRPLWASTGVKNTAYSDTLYVDQLVAPGIVNTMPEATLLAVEDHGAVTGDTVRPHYADAAAVWKSLQHVGLVMDAIDRQLESEGVDKFGAAWLELLGSISDAMKQSG
jgi:transaldolase